MHRRIEQSRSQTVRTMNILKYLSLCAVLLVLAGCTSPEQRAAVRLMEAEKLTWAYPDSALQLLQSIPSPELLTGSLQADYALLLSHLQHRCEKPASDSLTNLAWNHYKENADKDRRGKAWYMKGIVAEEYGKAADEVLSYYRQAEECVTEMKDKYMVRALYNRMGRLYRRMWNADTSAIYYRKALQVDREMGDLYLQADDMFEILSTYYASYHTDSIQRTLGELRKMSTAIQDSALLSRVCYMLAMGNLQYEDGKETESLLVKALQLTPRRPSYGTLHQLSRIYIHTGRQAKSDSLFQHALATSDVDVRSAIYNSLYRDALVKEEYQEATRYANLFINTQDAYYTDNRQKETLAIQQRLARMEGSYQSRIYLIIIGFFVVAAGSIYGFRRYRAYARQKYDELHSDVVVLQNNLTETEGKNRQQKEAMDELQQQMDAKKKELDGMNNRMKLLYGASPRQLGQDDIKAMQAALSLQEHRICDWSKDRKHIRHWLNISRNGFADRLYASKPMLKEQYIDICCLMALGLSIDETAFVLELSTSSIERYMTQICVEMNYPKRGRKGFIELLNNFVAVQKQA